MAFELSVAAKRDPLETAEQLARRRQTPPAPAAPAATIDVSGVFSAESARSLAQSIASVLHNPADTVIVRFQQLACEDPDSLRAFADWIAELRSCGHDVRVVTGDPSVRAMFADDADAPSVMQPKESDTVTGRRVIDSRIEPEDLRDRH